MHAQIAESSELLWQSSPDSSFILTMQTMKDVNGAEDVFVASEGQTSYSNGQLQQVPGQLLIYDGETGSAISSLNLGQEPISNAVCIDGKVIKSDSNGVLTCYSSALNPLWNETLAGGPQVMRVCGSSDIVLSVKNVVSELNVDNGSIVWSWTCPGNVEDLLATPDWTACYYPGNLTLLNANGSFMDNLAVPRPVLEFAVYTETLHQLDNTSFILFEDALSVLESSPNPTVTKFQVLGNSSAATLSEGWQIQVGGDSANEPFIVGDVEGDGFSDFMCTVNESGTLGLFSGETGNMIYPIDISTTGLSGSSVISDTGSGNIEVALTPYSGGLYLCSLGETNATVISIDPVNSYSSVVTIQNVPSENYSEIIAETEGGKINCFSAYIQTVPEFSVATFLAIISLVPLFGVVIKKMVARNKIRGGSSQVCS